MAEIDGGDFDASPAEAAFDTETDYVDNSESEAPATHAGDDSGQDEDEPTFTITVDGANVEVTLDDLTNGYLRQSDYTRKTQELAAERDELSTAKALWDRLNEDPAGTLEILQSHLGLNAEDDTEDLDPLELKVREHEAFIAQQQQQLVQSQIEREISALIDQYPDFDREAVLQHAIDNEIGDLELAYLHHNAHRERQARIKRANAEAAARKRGAPPVAGGSRAAGATRKGEDKIETLADALAAAKAELGWGA